MDWELPVGANQQRKDSYLISADSSRYRITCKGSTISVMPQGVMSPQPENRYKKHSYPISSDIIRYHLIAIDIR